jgi:hypothetical protein
MHRSVCAVFVSALILALSGALSAAIQVEIPDVPNYPYWEGCGPTAGGMIIGYWDAHGGPNLIPGSNDWATNQLAIKDMMASQGHFDDYVGFGTGMDRRDKFPTVPPLTYHADNSLADYMWSSRGGAAADTESFPGMQSVGLVKYAKEIGGYSNASGNEQSFYYLWDCFVGEINANRPMEFYVASSAGSSSPDHFVTAFGYRIDDQGHKEYRFYDTYGVVHWEDFVQFVAPGQQWSVYSGTYFTAPEPATFAFLAFGCAGLVARARKRRALPHKIAG